MGSNCASLVANLENSSKQGPYRLAIRPVENHGKERHRFWLHLRHAEILISNAGKSASMKIIRMALI